MGVALYSFTCFVVMLDLIEGRYYERIGHPTHEIPPVAEGDENTPGSGDLSQEPTPATPAEPQSDGKPCFVKGRQGWLARLGLLLGIFADTALVGYSSITVYAVIPGVLAAFSLLRRGTDFEYIVAEKPQ